MRATFQSFGERRGLGQFAPLVHDLYNNALATSSKNTYRSGTNHFRRFLAAFPKLETISAPIPPPSEHILTLCFFAVKLFLKKSIKSSKTIRSYIRHVKNCWIQNGVNPESLDSDVLERVLKGLKRRLPSKKDTRPAFLLPHYTLPNELGHPTSGQLCATLAAVIFGFFGLARFHILKKLELKALSLVDKGGHEYKMHKLSKKFFKKVLFSDKIIGFFFEVEDKFHPVARVYLPRVSDVLPKWKNICPLRALRLLWAHDLLKPGPCSKNVVKKDDLIKALKRIDGNDRDFKSQSLRIGAQTFFVTYGLPEAFVEFLARRKAPRVAQIYYRASPRLTLSKLRNFAYTFKEF